MVKKNMSPAAKERRALNKRCRELMRRIKSGKATDAEFSEFSAIPRDIGPSRGATLTTLMAMRQAA